MINYQIKIIKNFSELNPKEWDQLCRDKPFAKYKCLNLLVHIVSQFNPFFILIISHNKPVAGSILYKKFHFNVSALNLFLKPIAKFVFKYFPPVSCSIPLFSEQGMLISHKEKKSDWLPILLMETEKYVKKASKSLWFIFHHVDEDTKNYLTLYNESDHLSDNSFFNLQVRDDTYIDIKWKTYEDYEASLPGKKRSQLRRYRNRSNDAGLAIETAVLSPSLCKQLYKLIENVSEAHGLKNIYTQDYISKTTEFLDQKEFLLLTVKKNNEAIGCIALFRSDNEARIKWVGLDYEKTKKVFAYHYMMIKTVSKAIDAGVKKYVSGPTVYTLKKQMGAKFQNRYIIFKINYSIINFIFHKIFHFVLKPFMTRISRK